MMKAHVRDNVPKQLQLHGPHFGLNMRSLMVEGFELRFKVGVLSLDMGMG